jgi:predicted DNA binding protein
MSDTDGPDSGDDGHYIAEFRVRHPDFPMMDTVSSSSDFEIRSQFQPGTSTAYPEKYFVIEATDFDAVEAAADADPSVRDVELIDGGDHQRTYRTRFSEDTLLLSPKLVDRGVQIDGIDRIGDRWRFRIFARDRDTMMAALDEARETCRTFSLDRLYTSIDTDGPESVELTAKQHATLELAYREGYFDVPRDIDLTTLAAQLDVSDSAVSARLRQAVRTLVGQAVDPEDRS